MLLYPAESGVPILPALLLLALLLDAVVGDMRPLFRVIPHPVAIVGGAVGFLDRRLNRHHRSDRARAVRGTVVVILLGGSAWLLGDVIAGVLRAQVLGWLGELFLVSVLLAQRSLFDRVRAVRRALDDGGLTAARKKIRHIVGRDPDSLDAHGVARGAIESLAENFADGVVAPTFWYVLFGLPGLFLYKTVNTLDSMIGHRSPRHAAFGQVAARLDDLMNLVPARLAAVAIAFAALFAPRGGPLRALHTMWRDARKHDSPNAGWPEAAMAGALGVALLGPRQYGAQKIDGPWLGESFTARATASDISRGLYVYAVACFLSFVLIGLLTLGLLRF